MEKLQKFNLSTCQQHKQKKHKISDQTCKGRRILEPSSNNTEQINEAEGILMNILSRLPVRTLLQFKRVSKFWKTLISDPYFKRKHLNHAKNDLNSHKLLISYRCPKDGLFSTYYCPLSPDQLGEGVQELGYPSNSKPWQCAIHCCCDGLAVMVVCDDEHAVVLLWNPSTRESRVVQEIPVKGLFVRFGKGYDPTSGDYKILEFREADVRLSCEILSLRSGSWRKIDKHPRGFDIVLADMHYLAFVHEAFHWIGTSSNYYCVISLSISDEVYGEIELPEQILGYGRKIMIGVSVLEGMLCVYSTTLFERTDTFKLWAMKEYGVKESWHALVTIEEPWTFSAVPKYRFADGDVLLWLFGRGEGVFRTSRGGPLELWPRVGLQFGSAFTESLISPKPFI